MEVAKVAIGAEASVELKLEDGMIKVVGVQDGADGKVKLEISFKPQAFVAKLKAAIPGQIDDMIFDVLLAQLK